MKFFWPYLSNKNPKVGGKENTPFHFVAGYGLSDIADFMLEELQSVGRTFARDIFTYDQQACSSPRVLLVYGRVSTDLYEKKLYKL